MQNDTTTITTTTTTTTATATATTTTTTTNSNNNKSRSQCFSMNSILFYSMYFTLYSIKSDASTQTFICFLPGLLSHSKSCAIYQISVHDAYGSALEWLSTFRGTNVTRLSIRLLGKVM